MTLPTIPAGDTANARAWSNGAVYVAPADTAGPTDLTAAWAAGWEPLGWISDGGVTQSRSVSTVQKRGWQKGGLVRTLKTTDDNSFNFQCYEETAIVLGLFRPGSTVVDAAGIRTSDVAAATDADVRAFGFDFLDGDVIKRVFALRGEVTSFGDIVAKADDLTVYEFTVDLYLDADGFYFHEIAVGTEV